VQPPSLLRSLGPRFGALWAGQAISQFGSSIAFFSIPILIRHIQQAIGSESTLDYAIPYALETAPVFIVGLFGGVLLDRWNLRSVLIVTNLLRACAFFYLAGTVGELGLGTVFAMAFVIGSMSTLFDGGLYSVLPSVVRRERLADANSVVSITIQVSDSVGPFFGGVLVASFGSPAITLFLSGVLFTLGAITMKWVGPIAPRNDPLEERKPFLTEAANGIRYLWSESRLRLTTIAAGVANLVMGFFEGTFVVLFEHVTGVPNEAAIGFLLAALGIGGALGAVVAPSITRRFGLGRTMVLGLFIIGVGMLLFMFTPYGPVALGLQMGWAIGLGVVNIPLATIRQHYPTESMLGRVITASRAISWATLPLGALLGGWLGSTPSTYPWVARAFPVLLLLTGLWLMTTVVWSNTFGPGFEERETAQV